MFKLPPIGSKLWINYHICIDSTVPILHPSFHSSIKHSYLLLHSSISIPHTSIHTRKRTLRNNFNMPSMHTIVIPRPVSMALRGVELLSAIVSIPASKHSPPLMIPRLLLLSSATISTLMLRRRAGLQSASSSPKPGQASQLYSAYFGLSHPWLIKFHGLQTLSCQVAGGLLLALSSRQSTRATTVEHILARAPGVSAGTGKLSRLSVFSAASLGSLPASLASNSSRQGGEGGVVVVASARWTPWSGKDEVSLAAGLQQMTPRLFTHMKGARCNHYRWRRCSI